MYVQFYRDRGTKNEHHYPEINGSFLIVNLIANYIW